MAYMTLLTNEYISMVILLLLYGIMLLSSFTLSVYSAGLHI